jgi:NAD(P)-dependent dehydrogenase (short-subunit alcohol dehydrogenase family)
MKMTNKLEATLFGATSTTDEVLSGVNLKNKRVLVTGVSAGLGVETARSLVAHGAQVVGAARDLNKAAVATEQVRKDAAANGGSFELVELDLANLKSVRACADQLLKKGERFDRNAVRDESPRSLCPGQPDCVAYPRRRAAHQLVFRRPSLFERGP